MIIAKFHWTDLVICNHSGDGKTPSHSHINMVDLTEKAYNVPGFQSRIL